jgi:hypothetical protein
MNPPIIDPITNETNILISFSPVASKAAVVSSVGIGIKEESIPLKKRPRSPYLVKKNVMDCGITNIPVNNMTSLSRTGDF